MATRWKAVLALCVLCCETQLGTSAVHRDRTILTKVSLLEEEITDIRSRMDRIDRKRKTDLQIFRNDLTLHLEGVVPDVMSRVIEEMAKAGTIQGLIEGTVHTKVQSVEQQLQQLKTLALNSIKTKPPVPAKVGTLDSNKPTRKTFGKRFKRYDKIIKELKADGDKQKVMINELHSALAEQRMLLEVLRMDMEKMTSRSGSTTKPGSETVTSYSTLTTKGLNTGPSIKVVMAKRGSTAILPCSVASQTDSYRLWSFKATTLYTWNRFSSLALTSDRRLSIDRGYSSEWNLRIRDIRISDDGMYLCSNNDGDKQAVKLLVRQ
ncbi:uncharacterized protein LOC124121563 [Haliotis rufescens]|uniref:uncharacterized protein LOC124121563 n=1 Tax=Haliotis rufescens TaxID=6454 RepID=UPI00201EAA61|nr:uncharacterized protein LOC124121563 [Haliotis rufescens]